MTTEIKPTGTPGGLPQTAPTTTDPSAATVPLDGAAGSSAPQGDVCTIDFEPVGRRVEAQPGTSILAAAHGSGIDIVSICGGEGTCGRCRVVVDGPVSGVQSADRTFLSQLEIDSGERLACRAHVRGDVKVVIPKASMATDPRLQVSGLERAVVVEAAVRAYQVEAAPPSLRDLRSDVDRVSRAIETTHGIRNVDADPAVVRVLSPLARENDWSMTAFVRRHSLVGVTGPGVKPVGFAADLGTTKIAGYLVDLESGEELAAGGIMNPQIGYGEDVISRLAHAARRPDGAEELGRAVRGALDELIDTLIDDAGVTRDQIVDGCVVGNTVMHHLFLGLPTRGLSVAPFVASASAPMDVRARDVGLHIAPDATIHMPPCIGGFVGGDHVAMIIGADLDAREHTVVGVDIGTNTEIALCGSGLEYLASASCASGPAFEGAHIRDGMRAAIGAIERVHLTDDGVEIMTIGDAPAIGICGSGIVDVMAELHRTGRINDRGRFQRDVPGVREGSRGLEFELVGAERSGTGRAITVGQEDVNEIQLAKGAIATGIDVLLEMTGTDPTSVEELVVAGAFGSYINLDSALAIGLLPRLPNARLQQVGNAAGVGAKAALLSLRERARGGKIARRTSYMELTTYPGFQRRFAHSMAFPG